MIRLFPSEVMNRTNFSNIEDTILGQALTRLPKINPLGPWLAGGSVRRLFTGESYKETDFDFFFKNENQLDGARAYLTDNGAIRISNNEYNETWIIPAKSLDLSPTYLESDKVYTLQDQLKVQLIKFKFYNDLEEVLDSFDYTVSQFGFDGNQFVLANFALWDVARKRLVPHKITYATSSVKRMMKYGAQGYTVCNGCIGTILEAVAKKPDIIEREVLYID